LGGELAEPPLPTSVGLFFIFFTTSFTSGAFLFTGAKQGTIPLKIIRKSS
jgi:hypothetical protein